MAALTPPFSKFELLTELRTTLIAFAREIGRSYTFNGAFRLLGLVPPESSGEYPDPFHAIECEAQLNAFEVSSLWIAREAEALYDFAFEGRHQEGLDWSAVCENTYPFLRAIEAHETVVAEVGMPRYLRHVIELGVARAVVNGDCDEVIPIRPPERDDSDVRFGGYLPLRQVALLAGVDEKTVRNAAASTKAPLRSTSLGGRTYFEVAEVRRWLEARGQLLPTVRVAAPIARDLRVQPFTSPEDFFQYARGRASALSFDLDAGERGSVREKVSDWIAGWGSGDYKFNLEYAIALAGMIEVPVDELVPAVLALAQAVQRDAILREVNSRIAKDTE